MTGPSSLAFEIDALEERLLALGKAELAFELTIKELSEKVRTASVTGDTEAGDEAWALYQEAKAMLAAVRHQITAVEVHLYSRRRRLRKS